MNTKILALIICMTILLQIPTGESAPAHCKLIQTQNLGTYTKLNEPLLINVTGITFSSINEIRVRNETCDSTVEIPYTVLASQTGSGTAWAWLVFPANVSTASNTTYAVVYNDNTPTGTGYTRGYFEGTGFFDDFNVTDSATLPAGWTETDEASMPVTIEGQKMKWSGTASQNDFARSTTTFLDTRGFDLMVLANRTADSSRQRWSIFWGSTNGFQAARNGKSFECEPGGGSCSSMIEDGSASNAADRAIGTNTEYWMRLQITNGSNTNGYMYASTWTGNTEQRNLTWDGTRQNTVSESGNSFGVGLAAGGQGTTQTTFYDNFIYRSLPLIQFSLGTESETTPASMSITITIPTNGGTSGITDVNHTFSARDTANATFVLTAWLNGSVIYNNAAYSNNTQITSLQTMEAGPHNLTVFTRTTDSSRNATATSIYTAIDNSLIRLETPENRTLINTTSNAYWSYTPIILPGNITNATLWTNSTGTWAISTTNTSYIANGTLNNFSTDLPNTTIIWGIHLCRIGACYWTGNATAYPYLTISALGYNNAHLTSVNITCTGGLNPSVAGSSPLTASLRSFTTGGNANLICNITDRTYQHLILTNAQMNITLNNTQYTFTLTPAQLSLRFYRYGNQTAWSATGTITDLNQSMNFQNSSIVIVQQSLATGKVWIGFGINQTNATQMNWSQYYEYTNNQSIVISENLDVLTSPNHLTTFTVVTEGRQAIENAIIRVTQPIASGPFGIFVNNVLIGQRLTLSDGTATFLTDDSRPATVYVYRTGYELAQISLPIGDVSAVQIVLQKTTGSTGARLGISLPKTLRNRTLNIGGYAWRPIGASETETISINTDYRISAGLSAMPLTATLTYNYPFTLRSGTDFSATGTDSITVTFYINGVATATRTITQEATYNNDQILETPASIAGTTYNVILLLMLIIISMTVSKITNDEGLGQPTFLVGCIFLGFLSTSFVLPQVLAILHYALKGVKSFIKE